jgi:hypothetical protein
MPLYEILSRRPDGHETVHRVEAKDTTAAKQVVIERGLPEDQVVEVTKTS